MTDEMEIQEADGVAASTEAEAQIAEAVAEIEARLDAPTLVEEVPPVPEIDAATMERRQAVEDCVKIMNKGHNHRIKQTTLNYWREHQSGGAASADHVIIAVMKTPEGEPVSVSACKVDGVRTRKTITVTLPLHRRKGFGESALKTKLQQVEALKIPYRSTVAAHNDPCVGLMEKVGLHRIGEKAATTNDGIAYTQYIYSNVMPKIEGAVEAPVPTQLDS